MAHEYGFHVGRRGFFWTIPKCQVDATDAIVPKFIGAGGIKGALFSNGYGSIPMKIPFVRGMNIHESQLF